MHVVGAEKASTDRKLSLPLFHSGVGVIYLFTVVPLAFLKALLKDSEWYSSLESKSCMSVFEGKREKSRSARVIDVLAYSKAL